MRKVLQNLMIPPLVAPKSFRKFANSFKCKYSKINGYMKAKHMYSSNNGLPPLQIES